ncbi:hypothetical protein RAB80_000162 [Fusarium oxysporum f. sp. vasinfectum]|uniref:Hydrophobin n=1 Tax=Fusarium oxysporum f. sp. vasinfectum 25433 TaxID=1089449 RepID=X0KU96_FUSOX|nr:hypothetical protein FOTG_14647 [Fusarium oxysporum f. sp. vasinfectum 25433]KAK2682216.1 hypothetical protein RAB80_000162 [Fusarium oxysporum f. sp. vasinfectum]KAK2938579.1 hypothetical protein FoTM2_001797 [Fusarium oxysporum f. sp. vasinfectum]
MQFSIVALLVAATGALAAPGNRGHGDRGGDRGDRNTNTNTQIVTCSTGNSAYCCSPEYEGGVFNHYKCDKNINSCNIQSTIICCAQNAQGNNNHQSQTCSAFGNQKVIFT